MMCLSPEEYKKQRRRKQVNEAVKRHRKRFPDKVKERDRLYYQAHKNERRSKQKEKEKRDKEEEFNGVLEK